MGETEQEVPAEEERKPVAVDGNGEVIEEDDEAEEEETPTEDDEPSEDDAELRATIEREHELAAERQEEAASVEKQKREQDARDKKLNQLTAHLAKRYQELFGEDFARYSICPLCVEDYPGIRQNRVPQPEFLAAVQVAIGQDPDPPLNDDPYSRACDICGGEGLTKTNSHVKGQEKVRCLPCDGRGWVPVGNERDSQALPAANGAQIGTEVTSLPVVPPPLYTDEARTPEEDRLRQLGAIVVWPGKIPDVPPIG